MCGRLNVKDDPLSQIVSAALGIPFRTRENSDLRPTERVSTVTLSTVQSATPEHVQTKQIVQQDLPWGIKPPWAKRILINAQAETVASKPTFKKAFVESRCVVPCQGWYEWCCLSDGEKKTKMAFGRHDAKPIYMAGICVPFGPERQRGLVTLTCAPDANYRRYHHRLPLMLEEQSVLDWISGSPATAMALLMPPDIDLRAERT